MSSNLLANSGMPVWRDAGDICTLADQDRHLGHIVNLGEWHAFDAIHLNDTGNGFKSVGVFASAGLAKTAVERSVLRSEKALAAGSDRRVF